MMSYDLPLNERILLLRHRADITKKELASRVGVSPSTITSYEKGRSVPDYDTLADIAAALGVSINLLLMGLNDPNHEKPVKSLLKKRISPIKEQNPPD